MIPLTLIPWQNDFMVALADMVAATENPAEMVVLFPHNRPRRHLKGLLATHPDMPRPAFMPRMTSIADFMADLHRTLAEVVPVRANQLDLIEELHTIVRELRSDRGSLLSRLPDLEREPFLPWGALLAGLMDDLLRQDLEPQDLAYMEGEVPPYAAALLEQLRAIHGAYVSRLEARGWTTPGLTARFVLGRLDEVAGALEGKTVLAAGFYALSGSEDRLFKFLWERGTLVPVIHSDPALADNDTPHWATAEHSAWMRRWRVRAELPAGVTPEPRAPAIRFCEGYDRHSQLAGLGHDMRGCDSLDGTAVVLPDEGALLPVLHLLPKVDPELEPNISMGYPLARTSLARLVETLLELQENRNAGGAYHRKDMIALIRHPYLRLLGPETKPLRAVFHQWEAIIRHGERFIDPLAHEPDWDDPALADVDPATALPLLREVLDRCLTRFETVGSLTELGDRLTGLAELLHARGERLWHTYLLDAECLFRLTNSVIPQLKGAEISPEPLERPVRHAILRRLLQSERVSFEPDPLSGLQVLGVLETRLLHFRRLFVLDAVEDRLPGANPPDPLLPDPLRRLLALPDSRERDNVSGYNFYRLLMGADEAVVYYQSGIQPGEFDPKAVRSRFVEQLLWERERAQGRLLDAKDGVLRFVTFPTSSLPSGPPSIPVTDRIHDALMERLTKKGLSPSGLDLYMNCPKRFFYQYLSALRLVETMDEEGDRSEFGSLVHDVLRDFLAPRIGVGQDLGALYPAPLLASFSERVPAPGRPHGPHGGRAVPAGTVRGRAKARHPARTGTGAQGRPDPGRPGHPPARTHRPGGAAGGRRHHPGLQDRRRGPAHGEILERSPAPRAHGRVRPRRRRSRPADRPGPRRAFGPAPGLPAPVCRRSEGSPGGCGAGHAQGRRAGEPPAARQMVRRGPGGGGGGPVAAAGPDPGPAHDAGVPVRPAARRPLQVVRFHQTVRGHPAQGQIGYIPCNTAKAASAGSSPCAWKTTRRSRTASNGSPPSTTSSPPCAP
jgi:hypothetical protein